MSWSDLAAVAVLGLLGTGHCVGMCGGFALAVGADAPRKTTVVVRHLAYQTGKAISYLLLGSLLLLAGSAVGGADRLATARTVAGVLSGALMILLGAAYAGEWRAPARISRWMEGSPLCHALSAAWRWPSPFRSLLIGGVNGLLPCGFSLAVLMYLTSFGSVAVLAAGAGVFGLATTPGLLAVSLLGQGWSVSRRRALVRLSGAVLVLFGVLTVVRGTPAVHHWFHQHLMPERSLPMPPMPGM